jgi:hypothetical protein
MSSTTDVLQQQQQVQAPLLPMPSSDAPQHHRPKKVNPVYKYYREAAQNTVAQLRQEYDSSPEGKSDLGTRNKGVHCFMRDSNIIADEATFQQLVNKRSVLETPLELEISYLSAVDTVMDDPELHEDTMVVLYSPSPRPTGLIYGGIPCEVTDLAIRSTLVRQLRSPAMYLSGSNDLCELYASTSFYLPNVQVRQASVTEGFLDLAPEERVDLNVTMMSSVEAVVSHKESQGEQADIRLPRLIHNKLLIPFKMALRQNENREKLGMTPIRHVVIGDLGLRCHEKGVNTIFAQQLCHVLSQFAYCFDRVVLTGPRDLLNHSLVHFQQAQ